MEREDVIKMLKYISIQWHNEYKNMTAQEKNAIVSVWHSILGDYEREEVIMAFRNCVAHSEFAPKVGSIVNEIERIREAMADTPNELWSKIDGVLRYVHDNYLDIKYSHDTELCNDRFSKIENAYNSLPSVARLYLVDYGNLIKLSNMGDEELQFEKLRFIKTVPSLKEVDRVRTTTKMLDLGKTIKELQ